MARRRSSAVELAGIAEEEARAAGRMAQLRRIVDDGATGIVKRNKAKVELAALEARFAGDGAAGRRLSELSALADGAVSANKAKREEVIQREEERRRREEEIRRIQEELRNASAGRRAALQAELEAAQKAMEAMDVEDNEMEGSAPRDVPADPAASRMAQLKRIIDDDATGIVKRNKAKVELAALEARSAGDGAAGRRLSELSALAGGAVSANKAKREEIIKREEERRRREEEIRRIQEELQNASAERRAALQARLEAAQKAVEALDVEEDEVEGGAPRDVPADARATVHDGRASVAADVPRGTVSAGMDALHSRGSAEGGDAARDRRRSELEALPRARRDEWLRREEERRRREEEVKRLEEELRNASAEQRAALLRRLAAAVKAVEEMDAEENISEGGGAREEGGADPHDLLEAELKREAEKFEEDKKVGESSVDPDDLLEAKREREAEKSEEEKKEGERAPEQARPAWAAVIGAGDDPDDLLEAEWEREAAEISTAAPAASAAAAAAGKEEKKESEQAPDSTRSGGSFAWEREAAELSAAVSAASAAAATASKEEKKEKKEEKEKKAKKAKKEKKEKKDKKGSKQAPARTRSRVSAASAAAAKEEKKESEQAPARTRSGVSFSPGTVDRRSSLVKTKTQRLRDEIAALRRDATDREADRARLARMLWEEEKENAQRVKELEVHIDGLVRKEQDREALKNHWKSQGTALSRRCLVITGDEEEQDRNFEKLEAFKQMQEDRIASMEEKSTSAPPRPSMGQRMFSTRARVDPSFRIGMERAAAKGGVAEQMREEAKLEVQALEEQLTTMDVEKAELRAELQAMRQLLKATEEKPGKKKKKKKTKEEGMVYQLSCKKCRNHGSWIGSVEQDLLSTMNRHFERVVSVAKKSKKKGKGGADDNEGEAWTPEFAKHFAGHTKKRFGSVSKEDIIKFCQMNVKVEVLKRGDGSALMWEED